MESRKSGIDDLICKAEIEYKRMDTKGEGGGGMNWEIGIDMYIHYCV